MSAPLFRVSVLLLGFCPAASAIPFQPQAGGEETDSLPAKATIENAKEVWWEGLNGWTFSGRGLEIKNPEEGWRFRLGGRLHLDTVYFDDDVTPLNDDTDFRRLRIYASGRWKDISARASRDIGGSILGWKSLYLRYYGIDHLRITVGNQIPPFSMEENASSNSIPFMERSLANALSPGFLSGLAVSTKGDQWALGVGYFGNPISSQPKGRSRGEGWYMRGTLAPLKKDNALVHVGASLAIRDIEPGTRRYRVRSRPESGLTSRRLLDTRSIRGVEDTLTWGAESILNYERVTLQGEYLLRHINLKNTNFIVRGWSARAGVLLRGGQRHYRVRSGSLGSLVSPDKWGALELSARISRLDLNSKLLTGGFGTNYAIGLDWTLNKNVRVLAESILSKASPNRDGIDEDVHIYQFRLQFNF